jgi:predicted Zn-dependent protease
MVSDPADQDGGFLPFYELSGSSTTGLEIPAMTWIEGGVLKNLAWTVRDTGRKWCELPFSVRLEAMPGTQTATVEEMIARCEDGIYVNRFDGLGILDLRTWMMTGVTCDGCFHVKDGKLGKPVRDFRFLESPFHFFNRIHKIGEAARVPLGQDNFSFAEFVSTSDWPAQGRSGRWPRTPIIAPPMVVQDFNFSALAGTV